MLCVPAAARLARTISFCHCSSFLIAGVSLMETFAVPMVQSESVLEQRSNLFSRKETILVVPRGKN